MQYTDLPNFVQSFITDAIASAKSICPHELIAVYVFGGVAKGYFSKGVSDVDLLFVVDDKCDDEHINMLDNALKNLEAKYGTWETEKIGLLYFSFQASFFKPHYILRSKSILGMRSSDMFLSGKDFSFLKHNIKLFNPLLPSRLIMRNILKESKILLGQDLIKQVPIEPLTNEITAIFMTSWLLSLFGFISGVLSRSGTIFSIEAIKWYLHNIYSLLNNKTTTIDQAVSYALARNLLPLPFFVQKFFELRENYSHSLVFCAITPIYLLFAHSRATKYLRRLKFETQIPRYRTSVL